jgi:cytochrome oxidase assembly protein ShyY1
LTGACVRLNGETEQKVKEKTPSIYVFTVIELQQTLHSNYVAVQKKGKGGRPVLLPHNRDGVRIFFCVISLNSLAFVSRGSSQLATCPARHFLFICYVVTWFALFFLLHSIQIAIILTEKGRNVLHADF